MKLKKILSAFLAAALIVTYVPWYAFQASAANLDFENQVADFGTIHNWQEYFGDTTEYAGAVWTDKSVFTDETLAAANAAHTGFNVTKDSLGDAAEVLAPQENNFLVSLSAISSTKEIVGYENLPTDTVIMLDMSRSMLKSEIDAMIKAANDAINTLYAASKYNRVGVVAYHRDITVMMPIDRYTTGSDGRYIRNHEDRAEDSARISVDTDVRNSRGNSVSSTVNEGSGGTYTSGAINAAKEMLLDITDTTIDTGLI